MQIFLIYQVLYYIGDGSTQDTYGNTECGGIFSTSPWAVMSPALTTKEISNIKFNDNQIFITNACRGADGPFPIQLYKNGLRHYAAGMIDLDQPFDSDLGLNAFYNVVLKNMSLTDAMKQAGSIVANNYKANPLSYDGADPKVYGKKLPVRGEWPVNGIWGVIDGNNCFTYNSLQTPSIVNKKIPKNYNWKNWPFYPPEVLTDTQWPFPKYTY